MKKAMIVGGALTAFFGIFTLYSIYGYANDIKPFDISFPIGFALLTLAAAYYLYLVVKEKEPPFSRLGLAKTLAFCRDPENDFSKKAERLAGFLDSRQRLGFLFFCPVCDKMRLGLAGEGPCRRCKTRLSSNGKGFTLERKSYSHHRLEVLYSRDFNELYGHIAQYKPIPRTTIERNRMDDLRDLFK